MHHNANSIIQENLRDRISRIGDVFKSDVLTFIGPIQFGVDDDIRDLIEPPPSVQGAGVSLSGRLCVILETPGGSIEVTQRIADTFRHHYTHVEFVIPNYSFSAGTVLVMSGDSIWMDYYSVLGPIDPQLQRPGSSVLVPARGYLEQYNRLLNKSESGGLNDAEFAVLLNRFDPAELYQYEQAMELSNSLLKEWLVKYKFKDWVTTKDRQVQVTDEMKLSRAEEIARKLNDTGQWHSHGRGISMEVLRKELNLLINDLGADSEKNNAIRSYYRLLKDFMQVSGCSRVMHTKHLYIQLP